MSVSENDQNTEAFVFTDEHRASVIQYVQKPRFYVGDKVYLLRSDGSREGPYVIASLPTDRRCTLSLEDGQAVNNGEEIGIERVRGIEQASQSGL